MKVDEMQALVALSKTADPKKLNRSTIEQAYVLSAALSAFDDGSEEFAALKDLVGSLAEHHPASKLMKSL